MFCGVISLHFIEENVVIVTERKDYLNNIMALISIRNIIKQSMTHESTFIKTNVKEFAAHFPN